MQLRLKNIRGCFSRRRVYASRHLEHNRRSKTSDILNGAKGEEKLAWAGIKSDISQTSAEFVFPYSMFVDGIRPVPVVRQDRSLLPSFMGQEDTRPLYIRLSKWADQQIHLERVPMSCFLTRCTRYEDCSSVRIVSKHQSRGDADCARRFQAGPWTDNNARDSSMLA